MHELPLLIFTLCLQGSVGVTLWLALGRQYAVGDACLLAARFPRWRGRLYWPAWGCLLPRCTWAIP